MSIGNLGDDLNRIFTTGYRTINPFVDSQGNVKDLSKMTIFDIPVIGGVLKWTEDQKWVDWNMSKSDFWMNYGDKIALAAGTLLTGGILSAGFGIGLTTSFSIGSLVGKLAETGVNGVYNQYYTELQKYNEIEKQEILKKDISDLNKLIKETEDKTSKKYLMEFRDKLYKTYNIEHLKKIASIIIPVAAIFILKDNI